jgi:hypothetical protein
VRGECAKLTAELLREHYEMRWLLEPIALRRGQRPRVVVDPAIGRRRDAQVRGSDGRDKGEQQEGCGEDARRAHGRPVSPAQDAR